VVHQDPEAYRGEVVIWGGVIIETVNQPEGTLVTLLETPLDSMGFPNDAEYSRGRFMVRTAKYLDPEVYRKGVKLTLVASVAGKEVRTLGETQYQYAILWPRELHIWKERAPYYYYPPWRFYWGYPYWYWRGW
jgi:outer membrane lipoprotein